MSIPVNEVFETIQGEATYTGTPSVFIRLQGCPVGCGWCDTKHTWAKGDKVSVEEMLEKTEDAATYADISSEALIAMLDGFDANHVVITGGEPCIHDLTEWTKAVCKTGRTVQIETSGTHDIKAADEAFVTVSPKVNMPGKLVVLYEALQRANEIKMPVGKQHDIDVLLSEVIPYIRKVPVWLQPLSQNKGATELCVRRAIQNGWKVSIQTHKYIGVR